MSHAPAFVERSLRWFRSFLAEGVSLVLERLRVEGAENVSGLLGRRGWKIR